MASAGFGAGFAGMPEERRLMLWGAPKAGRGDPTVFRILGVSPPSVWRAARRRLLCALLGE